MTKGRERLAVLGIWHETNTFCLAPTGRAAFEAEGVLRGEEMWARHATAHTTLAGFWAAGQRLGVELVPLLHAGAMPSGTIEREVFAGFLGEATDALRVRGPWDGVLLAQHGAAVAEGSPDADGAVVSAVSEVVGPDVPIGLAVDMHANISASMVEGSTATTVYHTNPHVDARERGDECAVLVVRAIRGEVRPVQALRQVPVACDITRQGTADSPMRELMAAVDAVAARPGILSASLAEGYPWADVEEMGMSTLVVADWDAGLAQRAADDLAALVWASRADMLGLAMAPDAALLAAAARSPGPSLVLDVGDNIGGGGPGDSTVFLEAAVRLGIGGVLVILADPAAVVACQAAGVGARVALVVGGKVDPRYCSPVPVAGRVRTLSDGRFEEPTPTHGGFRFFDAGPTAVLETDTGHTLVLTSRAVIPASLEQLRALGLRPETFPILTAKGVISPRAGYERVATASFVADTAGVTAADVTGLAYAHRRRPLFPFERSFEWSPGGGPGR